MDGCRVHMNWRTRGWLLGCQSGACGNAFQSSAGGKEMSTCPVGGLLGTIVLLSVGIGRRAPIWPLTLALICLTASMQVDRARADGECLSNNTCLTGLCCSSSSYCGSGDAYCGAGCKGGPCYTSPSSSPTSNSPPSNSSGVGSCADVTSCGSGLCCSSANYCGTGDAYCGAGCKGGACYSNTPGSNPPSNSSAPEGSCEDVGCGTGLCCSQSYFCGTGDAYCGVGCRGGACYNSGKHSSTSTGTIVGIAVGAAIGAILLLCAVVCVARRRKQRKRRGISEGVHDGPLRIVSGQDGLRIRGFSYDEVFKATKGFSETLGRGAFGVVYKGVLEDGTVVAIKQLVDTARDAKDFEAEVKTLGSINHNNLVTLLGFTVDRNRQFLVYEFVEKGSLDQWIFAKNVANVESVLPWSTRVDILRGTARALAYLHTELQRGRAIIHLDIKPQNILLDEFDSPKLGDFGLAKLVGSKTARQTYAAGGTKGYMAPEVLLEMPATPKMDVYSFGMLILVVISGREPVDPSAPPDSIFLPASAIRKVYSGEQLDIVDPLLVEYDQIDADLATNLISIAMLCLQRDPDDRPDMSSVLRMMEGSAVSHDLPPTLRSDFELAERLIRGKPVDNSTSTTNPSDGSRDQHPLL